MSATLRNTNFVEKLSWYARLRPKSKYISFYSSSFIMRQLITNYFRWIKIAIKKFVLIIVLTFLLRIDFLLFVYRGIAKCDMLESLAVVFKTKFCIGFQYYSYHFSTTENSLFTLFLSFSLKMFFVTP